MIILSAIGDISRFARPRELVGYAGLGAGVHDSGKKHQGKSITKEGRKELRWALVEAAWRAVGSDPYWKAQLKRLEKRMHRNQASCCHCPPNVGLHLAHPHQAGNLPAL